MPKIYRITSLILLTVVAAGSVYAAEKLSAKGNGAPGDSPAAVVNGVTILDSLVNMRIKGFVAQGRPDTPELRKEILDNLINAEIMAQEAVKKGFDKQEETVHQLTLAKQSVLVGAFVQDYFKNHPISDEDIKQEYERIKLSSGDKEYKVRHILIKEESEAKSILAKIKKGEKFNHLANTFSLDPGSNKTGGLLGGENAWSMAANFTEPFAEALTNMKKGGVSEPVQTEYGWHIIKVDNVRDLKLPALPEIRQSLLQRLQQSLILQAVDELRSKAKVE